MSQRRRISLASTGLLVAVMAALGGCASSPNDAVVVARVNDQELTFDELASPADPGNPAYLSGEAVRAETTQWLRGELLASLNTDELYDSAVADLNIMCADILPPVEPTEESVAQLMAQIDAQGWQTVAESYTAATGASSSQPCQSIASAPAELIDPLGAASPGDVVDFADEVVGYGVIRLRPFDELDQAEFLDVVSQATPEAYAELVSSAAQGNVYVNPRVGAYASDTLSVEPVG